MHIPMKKIYIICMKYKLVQYLNELFLYYRYIKATENNNKIPLCTHQHAIVCVCVCVHPPVSAQSYLTLCDPMDCSPPGSSVHGIFQGSFSTQGSSPCLLHWRADYLPLSQRSRGVDNSVVCLRCVLSVCCFHTENTPTSPLV